MGHNNIRLVKYFILFLAIIVCIVIFCFTRTEKHIENSYKPMVKIDNTIYLWEKDLKTVNKEKLEKIGKIKYSYNTLNKKLENDDKNFSSNIYKEGTELYKYDDIRILVIGDDFISLLKK